ncbi:putative phosphoesterase [Halovenus aranensis]|jgi:putative SbcD/Mre11-related phosphoesterase|uniref:Putative phosphoesterase n=1 Tax=Halovenus aranensis TaxID=890420 RepID=A0A1G8Z1Y9_9EURY|nr:metallophosphoesterase [Halovenus aranensis]SDK08355.1 putative phosphoesterase [Halovenus aranensis]
MDALSAVSVRDRAIYLDGILVVADLHVGRGSASNVEFPVGDGTEMVERLAGLCDEFEPETVVFAGDLLHSFRTVPRQVEATVEGLCAAARDAGADTLVTPGNHDTMLDAVWSGETTAECQITGETVVCHGHAAPTADAERYIVGHDHPTITIEGKRRPCLLAGDDVYDGADLLMLPSFNRLVRGVEINDMGASDFMSPLVRDVDALAPVVRDTTAEETLTFPVLGELRHRL